MKLFTFNYLNFKKCPSNSTIGFLVSYLKKINQLFYSSSIYLSNKIKTKKVYQNLILRNIITKKSIIVTFKKLS